MFASDYATMELEAEDDTIYKVCGRWAPNASSTQRSWASEDHGEIIYVGVDFVREAAKVGHARNILLGARCGVAKEIAKRVVLPFEERQKMAVDSLERWKEHGQSTRAENQRLWATKPEYLQTVLGDKNVLLWKKILEDCERKRKFASLITGNPVG